MKPNQGEKIYLIFCDCIKQSHPTVKITPWKLLTREQKLTWDLFKNEIDRLMNEPYITNES